MKRIRKIGIVLAIAGSLLAEAVIPTAAIESDVAETESRTEDDNRLEDESQTEDENDTEAGEETELPEEPALEAPQLKAASSTRGGIKLSWKTAENVREYILYRSTEKTDGFKSIYRTKTKTSYLDTKCTPGKKYYYRLTVRSAEKEQTADGKVIAGRFLKQAELTNISNVSGSRKLVLSWKPVKGAEKYQVFRQNKSTGEYKKIATVDGAKTSYTDSKRTGGKVYTYKVCAVDANGGKGKQSAKMSQMAIDKNKKMIALTYDDGPSIYTPTVLDALEQNEAHATFFVVGNRVNQYQTYIKREVALGCEIGNHTYGHNSLQRLSSAQIQDVLGKTTRAVKKQTGVDIQVMRPPGGGYNSSVCKAADMPVILWSVDTMDWKTRSTSATIQCVKQQAFDGAIVLMHDIHKPTVQAADTVIKQLKKDGYQLVTVSEMAAYRGGMKDGKVYNKFRK